MGTYYHFQTRTLVSKTSFIYPNEFQGITIRHFDISKELERITNNNNTYYDKWTKSYRRTFKDSYLLWLLLNAKDNHLVNLFDLLTIRYNYVFNNTNVSLYKFIRQNKHKYKSDLKKFLKDKKEKIESWSGAYLLGFIIHYKLFKSLDENDEVIEELFSLYTTIVDEYNVLFANEQGNIEKYFSADIKKVDESKINDTKDNLRVSPITSLRWLSIHILFVLFTTINTIFIRLFYGHSYFLIDTLMMPIALVLIIGLPAHICVFLNIRHRFKIGATITDFLILIYSLFHITYLQTLLNNYHPDTNEKIPFFIFVTMILSLTLPIIIVSVVVSKKNSNTNNEIDEILDRYPSIGIWKSNYRNNFKDQIKILKSYNFSISEIEQVFDFYKVATSYYSYDFNETSKSKKRLYKRLRAINRYSTYHIINYEFDNSYVTWSDDYKEVFKQIISIIKFTNQTFYKEQQIYEMFKNRNS